VIVKYGRLKKKPEGLGIVKKTNFSLFGQGVRRGAG
jgi:hypothetical protein